MLTQFSVSQYSIMNTSVYSIHGPNWFKLFILSNMIFILKNQFQQFIKNVKWLLRDKLLSSLKAHVYKNWSLWLKVINLVTSLSYQVVNLYTSSPIKTNLYRQNFQGQQHKLLLSELNYIFNSSAFKLLHPIN